MRGWPLRAAAVLLAAAGAWPGGGRASGAEAPPAPPAVVSRAVEQGIAVELAITPLAGDPRPPGPPGLHEGQDVAVQFRVTDAAGQALAADRRLLFVSQPDADRVAVIDTGTWKVAAQIAAG
ncbi:MAG TPA: hypothetical protein VN999_11370, partial [Thermoanaerobaculia bacterium]|nr:hypothetical protein [Thermoanaerobaculia bacterium]